MKVVVVVPWAPSATRPRSLGLIEHLATNHEVHLVGAAWSDEDEKALTEIRVASREVVRMNRVAAAFRTLWSLPRRDRSLQQSYVSSRRFLNAVSNRIDKVSPDLVYFNVIRTAHMLPSRRDFAAVIDLDETRSNYYAMVARQSRNPVWRAIAKIEQARMSRAEALACQEFDTVLFSSPTDVTGASERSRLVRSPHLVGAHQWDSRPEDSSRAILFVGRQCYRANFEAVLWFAKNVFQRVAAAQPRVTLRIVGEKPVKAVRDLASDRVEVSGWVPEVAPYYAAAAISVVPIQMATGVQMKFIESLASGVPTVCTTIVAKGAGAEAGVHCLVADTPDEWVASIESLLGDPQLARRLSRAGGEWAIQNYSDAAIAGSLDLAIADCLAAFLERSPN